ncbi:hypothetical protein JCM1841_001300 [Sporobolomyces salmonicolor]
MKRSTTALRQLATRSEPVSPVRSAQRPAIACSSRTSRRSKNEVVEWRLRQQGGARSFFGIGEVLGVITNPGETLRSLADAKKSLEDLQQEIKDAKERSQIPASHTFSPLPGFYERPNEIKALERALGSVPGFTVLFGASSVGKTALLRQVLSSDRYHVLHFDLRIAGFADLSSLYFSLSQQLESYFAAIPDMLGKEWGWSEFEKESWAFKHNRLEIEKRIKGGGAVKTSDVAHLMELFQSALLKYWDFQPMTDTQRQQRAKELEEAKSKPTGASSASSKAATLAASHTSNDPTEARMRQGAVPKPALGQDAEKDLFSARSLGAEEEAEPVAKEKVSQPEKNAEEDDEPKPPPKRIPVFFLDEAHKLPALIQADDAMKSLLDSMLVLTKQDRLCHVLHATSDSFYMMWLRQWNTAQHCQMLTIGDCSKAEAKGFFEKVLLPHIPEKLRPKIQFDDLYQVFGGKIAHLSDYTAEFVNNEGNLAPHYSSHFLQAHALLNLQLIHARPSASSAATSDDLPSPGFQIYSPLRNASPHAAPTPSGEDEPTTGADFKVSDVLTVLSRLQPGERDALPYFPLCRELGARAVDGMVRGRILELRWSATVTEEGEPGSVMQRQKERIVGPVVVPTTAVVRHAMGVVLKEWQPEAKAA